MSKPAVTSPITIRYGSPSDQTWVGRNDILGVFGNSRAISDSRYCYAGLPALDKPLDEIWLANKPVEQLPTEEHGAIKLNSAASDDVMLICLQVDRADLNLLPNVTENCYTLLFEHSKKLGFGAIIRIWNYIANINDHEDDAEAYKQFCLGRHNAYTQHQTNFIQQLPAASALGLTDGGLLIYALATKTFGQPLENPRQVSAYHYPREYGPQSPSFARALLQPWPLAQQLFISGTASVLGHASEHLDNVTAQARETLHNIKALVTEANNNIEGSTHFDWQQPDSIKVYLRHQQHQSAVTEILRRQLKPANPIMFLQADICRRELLLEVEGIYCY